MKEFLINCDSTPCKSLLMKHFFYFTIFQLKWRVSLHGTFNQLVACAYYALMIFMTSLMANAFPKQVYFPMFIWKKYAMFPTSTSTMMKMWITDWLSMPLTPASWCSISTSYSAAPRIPPSSPTSWPVSRNG